LYTHVVRLGHLPEALENDDDKSYERFALEVTSEEENVRHDLCRNFNQVVVDTRVSSMFRSDS